MFLQKITCSVLRTLNTITITIKELIMVTKNMEQRFEKKY